MKRTRLVILASIAAVGALLTGATACNSDSKGAPLTIATGDDGSTSDTGSPVPEAAISQTDGGSLDGAAAEAAPSWYPDAGGTVYDRLGGHAGIRALMDSVLQAELGDPLIASYFVNQTSSSVQVGHPTLGQLAECMTDQLGHALAGPDKYPAVISDDSSYAQYFCRDVLTAHISLNITGGTFDRFVMIAAGALQAMGVRPGDIQAIGTAFANSREDVVSPGKNDAGPVQYDASSALF
jgi:hypothetical protein